MMTVSRSLRAGSELASLSAGLLTAGLLSAFSMVGCAFDDGKGEKTGSLRRTSGELHAQLAEKAIEQGRFADAERSAKEALRVDPTRADVFALLGNALLRQGEIEAATEASTRALLIDDNDPDALLLAADCATYSGRDSDAEREYARAAEAGSREASLAHGVSMLDAGNLEDARSWIDRGAPRGDRGSLTALLVSGHLWGTGKLVEAEEVLTEAIVRAPEDQALKRRLALIQFARVGRGGAGPLDTGASTDGAAGITSSRQSEDRLLRAARLMRSGQAREAAAVYRKLIPEMEDGSELRVSLGEALLTSGDSEGAAASFRSAIEIDRTRVAFSGLGRAELARGRVSEATVALETASAMAPTHTPTRSLLVLSYLREGRMERARAEADRVTRDAPGSPLDLACRDLLERAVVGGGGSRNETSARGEG